MAFWRGLPARSRDRAQATGLFGLSWLLGVLVAVASWSVVFATPSTGLDPSWWAALYMGAHRGMHFGSQIIFTYGPLGFLRQPWLWYGGLATLAFIYSSALQIALAVTLVSALRRTLSAPVAVLLAAGVLLATPERDVALALAGSWCVIALSQEPPGFGVWLVAVGGSVLGAVELLVELRSGPVIWGICLITLIARSDWRRGVPVFVACAVGAFAAAWFAASQSISNLGAFIRYAGQIVSGYSEAMGLQGPGTGAKLAIVATVVLGLALVAACARSAAPVRRARVGAALVGALISFSLYKEAVVRAEVHHETIFFSTLAVLCAALAYGRRRVLAVATVVLASAIAFAALPGDTAVDLNPVSHVSSTFDQVRLLVSSQRRKRAEFVSVVGMIQHYQLDEATLVLLRGHTVHVDPWEAAAAWLYRLNWDPLPVFQNYSAYTSGLDRLDAHDLTGSAAPERILRENTELIDRMPPAIDGRLRAWDSPAATLEMLCTYLPLRTTPRWQVLAKTATRCGAPHRLATISTRFGAIIRVPPAPRGSILYAVVRGAGVSSLFDRARTFLYRAKFRYVSVNGDSYRLVPGTAVDGLLLDAAPGVDYPKPFNLSPGVRTLKFTGPSGPLRIDLEWMPVRPAH